MINKLLPEQIASMWDVLSYGIEQSLPPIAEGAPDRLNRLLAALLGGKMQCWVTSRRAGETVQLEAVITTQVVEDEGSGVRSLLVYSLYGFRPLTTWREGVEALSAWAHARGCSRLLAYSNNEKVLEAVAKFGGASAYKLITIPLLLRANNTVEQKRSA